MAPRIIRPLSDVSLTEGLNKARTDVTRQLVSGQEQARQSHWQVMCGAVQVGLASAGWSCVALENSNGVVVASSGGRSDRWGVQVDQPLQSGARVMVAVNWLTDEAIVLGHLSNKRTDVRNQFDIPTYVGSWSDASRDVLREVYNVAEDAGGTCIFENGNLSDVHQGDYMVRSSLGTHLLVSNLTVELAVDDITGLWVNLADQSLELSARQLSVAADGLKLHKSLTDRVASLQLSGRLQFHGDPQPTVDDNPDSWSETDCSYAYRFDIDPVEVFNYNVWGLDGAVAQHHTGDSAQTGDGVAVDFRAMTLCRYPAVSFVEYQPTEDEDTSEWYPPVGTEQTERDQLAERLTGWRESLDGCHFTQPLLAMAAVSAKWVASSERYVRLKKKPDGEAAGSTLVDALYGKESVQFGDEKLDPTFIGSQLTKLESLLSWLHPQSDGSLLIGNEAGTSIRLMGTGIFLEGTSFRGAFRKDVSWLARDINFRGNRDVSLMAGEHTRLCSKRNIAMVAGLSGKGGVLIEGRSTTDEFELPDDAQKANYAGVAIRSTGSPLLLQGGDILVHAGAVGGGQLVVKSDGGPISFATPYRVITHSSARLDTYGPDPFNPRKTHYYGPNSLVYDGNLMAGSGLFTQSIRAASDIQSISGRMADSQGGKILKVSPQGITRFTEAVQNRQQTANSALTSWIETAQLLSTRLQAPGGPLNRTMIGDLSMGFVSTLRAADHYGTDAMQPTGPSVFQAGWGVPLDPMEDFEVTYKPNGGTTGGPTYGWPGSTREVNFTLPVLDSLSRRLSRMLTEEAQPTRFRQASFSEVFATLKDRTDGI